MNQSRILVVRSLFWLCFPGSLLRPVLINTIGARIGAKYRHVGQQELRALLL